MPRSHPLTLWRDRLLGGGSFLARHSWRGTRHLARFLALALGGTALVGVTTVVLALNGRADLSPWHQIELEEEFNRHRPIRHFREYLALEDKLFAEVDRRIYSETSPADPDHPGVNRYQTNSLADPRQPTGNGNRTFEWAPPPGAPVSAGVLLLHGMSDSPYSLSSLGHSFRERGAHVIGLRLPGHGTAPSGLVDVSWEDMHAAVILAIRHLREQVGDRPLFLVGYSHGGALSVRYALESLDDDSLPAVDGIVLISPAIGVTPMAALAVWQSRLGNLLGMEKLAWNSILPEYDPYKYVSFAVNAGHQVHRLTAELAREFKKRRGSETLDRFPPVLAFQSVVDATVSTPALIEGLFAHLPAENDAHELVIFDLNRAPLIESVITGNPTRKMEVIAARPEYRFRLTVLTNALVPDATLVIRTYRQGRQTGQDQPTTMAWPPGLYSLSHVSLPFAPDDPLYGDLPATAGHYRIGSIALRGERGVLQISASDQLRLRWNPFHPYLEQRILDFFRLPPE